MHSIKLLFILHTVKLLIDAGADLNATDQDGDTPLTLARENNHEDVVKILQENGAQ